MVILSIHQPHAGIYFRIYWPKSRPYSINPPVVYWHFYAVFRHFLLRPLPTPVSPHSAVPHDSLTSPPLSRIVPAVLSSVASRHRTLHDDSRHGSHRLQTGSRTHRPCEWRKSGTIQGDKFYRSGRIFQILSKYCAVIANPAISKCSYTPLFPLEIPPENCYQIAVPCTVFPAVLHSQFRAVPAQQGSGSSGAGGRKYRFYGQIFNKTVITAWDVPQKMRVFFAAIIPLLPKVKSPGADGKPVHKTIYKKKPVRSDL